MQEISPISYLAIILVLSVLVLSTIVFVINLGNRYSKKKDSAGAIVGAAPKRHPPSNEVSNLRISDAELVHLAKSRCQPKKGAVERTVSNKRSDDNNIRTDSPYEFFTMARAWGAASNYGGSSEENSRSSSFEQGQSSSESASSSSSN